MSSSSEKGKTPEPTSGGKDLSSPVEKKEVSEAAFQAAFEIAKILKGLSNKDQLSAMQMAGVQANLSVTSQFVAAAAKQQAVIASVPRGTRGGRAPPPTKKWGEDVKKKQSEIASLNKEIAEASKAIGKQLPEGHDLLKRRDQSFRELKALKGQSGASQ